MEGLAKVNVTLVIGLKCAILLYVDGGLGAREQRLQLSAVKHVEEVQGYLQ